MPQYTFQSGKKIQDFFFSMRDAPSIGAEIVIDGKKWTRIILSAPAAQIDSISNINPDDPKDFVNKTGKKTGTYGQLVDQAAELAEKRREKHGVDKIREKFEKDHKAKRKGRDNLKPGMNF